MDSPDGSSRAPADTPAGGGELQLRVDGDRLARLVLVCCIAAEAVFVVLDYHINYGHLTEIVPLRTLANTAREDGLPSWFGTTQTFLAALTLWLLYVRARCGSLPRWKIAGWLVLALFFTYMAVDDGAKVHERLGTTFKVLRADAGQSVKDFFPSYAWQVAFLPFFGAMGAFTLGFLWFELRERRARALIVIAIGCFVLAVGMDFIEGLDEYHPWNVYTSLSARYEGIDSFALVRFKKSGYETLRHFSKSLEEAIEMLGNSILWFLFLRRLFAGLGEVRLRIRAASLEASS